MTTVSDDELIARLEAVAHGSDRPYAASVAREAAARLRSLSESKREMVEALELFARLTENYANSSPSDWVGSRGAVYVSDIRRARAVIAKEAGHAE